MVFAKTQLLFMLKTLPKLWFLEFKGKKNCLEWYRLRCINSLNLIIFKFWVDDTFNMIENSKSRKTSKLTLPLLSPSHPVSFPAGNTVFLSSASSITQSCLILCNPTNRSTPGLPVHHQLPESTQTHVHRVDDAIQPSHPVVPFSSCPQSFPASGSFQMSQLFTSGGQSIGVSASTSVFQWIAGTDLL